MEIMEGGAAAAQKLAKEEDKGLIEIRGVQSDDKMSWLELFQQQVLFHENRIDYLSTEQYEITWRRLLDPTSSICGLVAHYNGVIVGIAHYLFHPSTWTLHDYCYLQDLFVHSSVRGKGIGRKLLEEVHQIAKIHESPRLYWVTKSSNEQARVLYDSFIPASDMVQYLLPITTKKESSVEQSSFFVTEKPEIEENYDVNS